MSYFDYTKIAKAYKSVRKHVLKTPLITSEYINTYTKANIFFKLENLQFTGSFKLRGAINKINQLNYDEKQKGIVAYSSGNHAQAVAYAAKINNINSKIVMPSDAPVIKINNTKKYGSKVILYDRLKENREEIGQQISTEEGRTLIKPYDDIDIISGQGTCGKEIADDLVNLNIKPDIFLCCCGGGGLIAGTSTYLKYQFPNIKCFSVEPEGLDDTKLSLEAEKIIPNKKGIYSICDALLAPQPGDITFPINKKILSGGLSVNESDIKKTIIYLAENLKIISEPGGAVAAARFLLDAQC